jgi:hypothetical protein
MNDLVSDLEAELKKLQPMALPHNVVERIGSEIERARQPVKEQKSAAVFYLKFISAVAAAVAFAVCREIALRQSKSPVSAPGPTTMAIPATSGDAGNASRASRDEDEPATIIQDSNRDETTVEQSGKTRVIYFESIETAIHDPDGSIVSVEWTGPTEQLTILSSKKQNVL